MKKIVKARKAIQGLALALALSSAISGCSFDTKKGDLAKTNFGVESVDQSIDTVDIEVEEVEVPQEEIGLDHEHVVSGTVSGVVVKDKEEKEEVTTNKVEETKQTVMADYIVVMFEGEELVVPNLSKQYTSGEYTKNSIIKALKLAGFESKFSYRKQLAAYFEIAGYRGTAEQNVLLLSYLRNPELFITQGETQDNSQGAIGNNGGSQGNIQDGNQGIDENGHNHENGGDHGGNGDNTGNPDNRPDDKPGNRPGDKDKDKHVHGEWKEIGTKVVVLPNGQHRIDSIQQCQKSINGKMCTQTRTVQGKPVNCDYDANDKCPVCGSVKEHVHGEWKEVDTKVVALDNGQHRVDSIQQCQKSINGKICTETRVVQGIPTSCTYGDDDQCPICGNIKGHVHGDWKTVKTETVQLANGQHRIDVIQQCKVLINGKECTYTRTVEGTPVNCSYTLEEGTKCTCGNKHTHNKKETVTDTIVYTGADGHKYKITYYCDSCDYTFADGETAVIPHTEEITSSNKTYDNTYHWTIESADCSACGYILYTDKEVGKKEHSKDTTTTYNPLGDTGNGHFQHEVSESIVCTDGCGWSKSSTNTVDCSPLDGECADCHQSTVAKTPEGHTDQHTEYVIDDTQDNPNSAYCKIKVIGCNDCDYTRTEDIEHNPIVRDEENYYWSDELDCDVIDRYCQRCGEYVDSIPFTPSSQNINTPGDEFSYEIASYTEVVDELDLSETEAETETENAELVLESGELVINLDELGKEYTENNEDLYQNEEQYSEENYSEYNAALAEYTEAVDAAMAELNKEQSQEQVKTLTLEQN